MTQGNIVNVLLLYTILLDIISYTASPSHCKFDCVTSNDSGPLHIREVSRSAVEYQENWGNVQYLVDGTMILAKLSLIAASCVVLCNGGLISFIKRHFSGDPDLGRNVVRPLISLIFRP